MSLAKTMSKYPKFGGISHVLRGASSKQCVVCTQNPGRRYVVIQVDYMRGNDLDIVICHEEACLHKIRREPHLFINC